MMALSIVEQSPRLRSIYTQLCFCYPITDKLSQAAIKQTLTRGLERLTASFPWLPGQVVQKDTWEGHTGNFKVMPFESLPRLIMKDHVEDNLMPTMDTLRMAQFPFGMLDEKIICPRTTLSGGPGETLADPYPVLLLQANFIIGGLLLCVVASHSTMDMMGQGQVISLLSKACRNEPFTTEEIRSGNLDRRDVIPLLDGTWNPDLKVDSQNQGTPRSQTTPHDTLALQTINTLTWAYFAFSPTSLTSLKKQATSTLPAHSSKNTQPNFISTDDALCALLWQSIARARLTRLPPTTGSVFNRQVEMRRHLDIPHTYLGNVVTKASNTSTLHELAGQSLGLVAHRLRSELDPKALKYKFRSDATMQSRGWNLSTGGGTDRTKTVVMSSWTKVDCWNVDFGFDLGPPESIRRPRFEPLEGVVYLLPNLEDSGIVAGLCLRIEDMELLKEKELRDFGRYVG